MFRLPRKGEAGFSMLEMLISLAVLSMAMSGLASLLIQNSRINKQQQMTAEVQANARNCLSLIVQRMRSAGWNPSNAVGISTLTLDTNLGDDDSEIEIFADLNADGDTDEDDEQVFVRHDASANRILWKRNNTGGTPFKHGGSQYQQRRRRKWHRRGDVYSRLGRHPHDDHNPDNGCLTGGRSRFR